MKFLKWMSVSCMIALIVIYACASIAVFVQLDWSMLNPANWNNGGRFFAGIVFWFCVAVGFQCWREDYD